MTASIDALPLAEALSRFAEADLAAVRAAAACDGALVGLIEKLVAAWEKGGRLLLFGAGTSGRVAAQQAAELLPTFGLGKESIDFAIAGGLEALMRAREGAEDSLVEGVAAVSRLDATEDDLALGISASGKTPFVRGCLGAAKKAGCLTILLTTKKVPAIQADVILWTPTGPELVEGSTRLKAGTAAKCVLDRLTTLAASELGLVVDGLMVAMRPTNAKLRERAIKIVGKLRRCPDDEALALLERLGWDIRQALDAPLDGAGAGGA